MEATNGKEAIEIARKEKPDVILMDIVMPVMTGLEACRILKEDPETFHIPVIIITALGDLNHKLECFKYGADEFIIKPYDKNELLLRVRNLFKIKSYHDLLKDYSYILEREIDERTKELQEAYQKLDLAYLELIQRLGRAAEYRDDETGEHTKRVGKMCRIIAEALEMPEELIKNIEYATPMHDIGKIGIPDKILLKPGKLTPEEFEVMKRHTYIGADILSKGAHPVMEMAERVALTHHERWDGKGYPLGLKEEEIPIEGRICSIVDFFDACTSRRIYRAAMDVEKVLDMIRKEKGMAFDPQIVEVFLSCIDDILKVKEEYSKNRKRGEKDEDLQHNE